MTKIFADGRGININFFFGAISFQLARGGSWTLDSKKLFTRYIFKIGTVYTHQHPVYSLVFLDLWIRIYFNIKPHKRRCYDKHNRELKEFDEVFHNKMRKTVYEIEGRGLVLEHNATYVDLWDILPSELDKLEK